MARVAPKATIVSGVVNYEVTVEILEGARELKPDMTCQRIDSDEGLPPEDLARFRSWFLEFDGRGWDQQIESDSTAGKFSSLVAEALADYKAGRAREL